MHRLRQELNQAKSQLTTQHRTLEESESRHEAEVAGLKKHLQQETNRHSRAIDNLKEQHESQITRSQKNLEVTIVWFLGRLEIVKLAHRYSRQRCLMYRNAVGP